MSEIKLFYRELKGGISGKIEGRTQTKKEIKTQNRDFLKISRLWVILRFLNSHIEETFMITIHSGFFSIEPRS